jgi:adenylate cyclase
MENPPMPKIDFEAEGLLEGLDGEAREARLKLLRELAEDGVSLEELREAVAVGRLALLPVERVLTGEGGRYTTREIAEQAGVGLEELQRANAALGVSNPDPDSKSLGEMDLEAAERLRTFREFGLPEDQTLQVARTIGMGTSRIAQANRELFLRSLVEPGDDEYELARRFEAAAKVMVPLLGPLLAYSLQRHLLEQIRSDVIGAADLASGELSTASEVAVAFADLVDFTKLGERIPVEELGRVATRLEEMASEVARSPVRLVKLIGDAAMLVSPDPRALADAALSLVEAADAEGEDFPPLRAGIAFGSAVGQGGDYYGHPINLASRITEIARPASALASEEAKEAIGDGLHYSFAGERSLKGIKGGVRLYRVRREPKSADR